MISVDTNVVVRFLTGDDPEQFGQSAKVFQAYEVFIPDTVILETAWVLRFAYHFDREHIIDAFQQFFGLPSVHLRDAMAVFLALDWYANGLDFADALHLAQSQHCSELITFDRQFVARSRQLDTIPVRAL
jgi:predicted nucleic-acid-binding protein